MRKPTKVSVSLIAGLLALSSNGIAAAGDDGAIADTSSTTLCVVDDSRPDIEPLPAEEALELAESINARPRFDRRERGAQRVEDKVTGERRNITGAAAGRGSFRSFKFRKPPKGTTRVATVHSHPGRGYKPRERINGNAPSTHDQQILNISRRPVITVGSDVITQLYRRGGQDYLDILEGDISDLPSEEDLAAQGIVVCLSGNKCLGEECNYQRVARQH